MHKLNQMSEKMSGPFIALQTWASMLANGPVVKGEEYEADYFRPGGLKDALTGGIVVPKNAPKPPSKKRVWKGQQ